MKHDYSVSTQDLLSSQPGQAGFLPVSTEPFPSEMIIIPISRWPTELPPHTIELVSERIGNLASDQLGEQAGISSSDWRHSIQADGEVDIAPDPSGDLSSIILVTLNGLIYTQLCLESLLTRTDYPRYEVIVVDNGSSDGTPSYLRSLASRYSNVRLVFNDTNQGFARATNQGLAIARGNLLILLNNDTIVPHGWLTNLAGHLQDDGIGLVGPVTNRAGNQAQIEVPYVTYGEFTEFARRWHQDNKGVLADIEVLTMFCVAMRRDVYEQIGPLDERFGIGMFEDDDYSKRVRDAGYRVVCAEDTIVHHFGQATLGELAQRQEYGTLFHRNRALFEQKWGVAWSPHRYRHKPRYDQLVCAVREVVQEVVPSSATVIVVSKGDSSLLDLGGRRAWHFPQTEDGHYAGYYPVDSAGAITDLEQLRAKGGDFLLFPSTTLWWLDHYSGFKQYLEERYPVLIDKEDVCRIYRMR